MEVFSRDASYGVNRREKKTPLVMMTPTRLSKMFASRLQDICANFEENHFPISLVGCLEEKPNIYNEALPFFFLRDWEGEGEISLELTPSMLSEAGVRVGDYVKLFGILRARLLGGVIVPRFEVMGVSAYSEDDEASPQIAEARDTALLSILRDYVPYRYDFPRKSSISLLLITLEISQIEQEKFIHMLGGVWHNRNLRVLSFSLDDMALWKSAFENVEEDILVLLSSEEGCAALEDPTILSPLVAVKAHRVVVLDRASYADVTDGKGAVISYLADRAFSSSKDAGMYLRGECGRIWQKFEEERAMKEELDALRDSLTRLSLQPRASVAWVRFTLVGMLIGFLLCVIIYLFL